MNVINQVRAQALTPIQKFKSKTRKGRMIMKTKKFFAVEIFDNTCNVLGHETGIYGKNDYSWVDGTLNGGDGCFNMTEQEAKEVKADFERYINEHNLNWASVEVDSIEVPFAETMQDVADYYNECGSIDMAALDAMIEYNGWINDKTTDEGICHNDTLKVIINDTGQAVVEKQENDTRSCSDD